MSKCWSTMEAQILEEQVLLLLPLAIMMKLNLMNMVHLILILWEFSKYKNLICIYTSVWLITYCLGLRREPKWSHTRDLHYAINLCKKAILTGKYHVEVYSKKLEVSIMLVCVWDLRYFNVYFVFPLDFHHRIQNCHDFKMMVAGGGAVVEIIIGG